MFYKNQFINWVRSSYPAAVNATRLASMMGNTDQWTDLFAVIGQTVVGQLCDGTLSTVNASTLLLSGVSVTTLAAADMDQDLISDPVIVE